MTSLTKTPDAAAGVSEENNAALSVHSNITAVAGRIKQPGTTMMVISSTQSKPSCYYV